MPVAAATFASAAARVLDSATKAGAQYADVQFWTMRTEGLDVRNGDVRDASDVRSMGYGVRALVDGSWGFYGSDQLTDADFDRVARAATAIAQSGTRVPDRMRAQTPSEKIVARWETPFTHDPASVALGARAAHLLAVEKSMHVAKNVIAAFASMNVWTTDKEFYSTAGSAISPTPACGGGGLRCDRGRPRPGPANAWRPGRFRFVSKRRVRSDRSRAAGRDRSRLRARGRRAGGCADAAVGDADLILDGGC